VAPVPLPGDLTLRFPPGVRRVAANVLIGGTPLRVLRLTPAGAARVDGWMAGRPVGPGRVAGELAARLVDAGLALPCPPASPLPDAAVVVPVRDDPSGLAMTLDALAATAGGRPVVVVDDGSEPPVSDVNGADVRVADGSEEVGGAEAMGVVGPDAVRRSAMRRHLVQRGAVRRVVRRPVAGGPAAARNTGLLAIPPETEVVIFVDGGCVPSPGWVETLLAHFADPGLGAVAPRVTSRADAGTPRSIAAFEAVRSPLDLGPLGGPVRPGGAVPYVPSAVLAVRTSALVAVGGFDEALRFGEDVDLVWRLHGAGWRIRYEPAANATHPARPTIAAWLRQRFDYGRSAAPLAARHRRAVAPLSVSPWTAAVWALLAGGQPGPALLIAAGSAEALARRVGSDRAIRRQLRRLALSGHARAGGPIASAVRRAWLPPAVAVAVVAWSRRPAARTRVILTAAAITIGPGVADWWASRPAPGPATWTAWRLADDLAYQAGVWHGALRARSAGALLPKW
jgi:mycofactocin system glycosyltransferase